MAKHFNLSDLLTAEKSTITIGEHTFTVNDEKTNVILMNAALTKNDSSFEMADIVTEFLLGKEQKEKIDAMKLSVSAHLER